MMSDLWKVFTVYLIIHLVAVFSNTVRSSNALLMAVNTAHQVGSNDDYQEDNTKIIRVCFLSRPL